VHGTPKTNMVRVVAMAKMHGAQCRVRSRETIKSRGMLECR